MFHPLFLHVLRMNLWKIIDKTPQNLRDTSTTALRQINICGTAGITTSYKHSPNCRNTETRAIKGASFLLDLLSWQCEVVVALAARVEGSLVGA